MVGCNLCGSMDHRPRFQKDDYRIVQCANCGMVFITPVPTPAQLAGLYAERYFAHRADEEAGISYCDYESEADVLLPNFHARLAEIERFVQKGRILDLGCAYGFFLKAAQERGWEAWGVELSEHAASYASDRFGLNVLQTDLLAAELPFASFDAVTLWDTIEHLVDPLAVLSRARDLLRPGGVIAVGTDDISAPIARLMGRHWYAIGPPWHTHHFSRPTLRGALQRAGFEVLEVKRRGKLFELRSIAARLKVFYPGCLTRALHHWMAQSPLGRRRIYLNRGDWMAAYALKADAKDR